MTTFDPNAYSEICSSLLQGDRLCELGPGTPNHAMFEQLQALDAEAVCGTGQILQPDFAACCMAGLWLLHNYLDESHQISQSVHSSTGSYWHAIMHRREGDFPNAKYWFRRAGRHPVEKRLLRAAQGLAHTVASDETATYLSAASEWDADRFTDLCEASIRGRCGCESLAREIARAEWQLLFDYCYRTARSED